MPKVYSLQQQREDNLMLAIERAKRRMGIRYDKDVAELIGISPNAYSRYSMNNFWLPGLDLFAKMARKLKFTDKEVCAIIGVPYKKDKKEDE